MSGRYVLDSSVLLSSGKGVLQAFGNAEVIIPLVVLRELESKRNHPELGLPARDIIRTLEELRTQGDLNKGVTYGDALVRIELNHINDSVLPPQITADKSNDTRILAVAKALDAVLVSKDLPLRILASVVGVQAEDYTPTFDDDNDINKIQEIYVSDEDLNVLYETGSLKVEDELVINSNILVHNYSETAKALAVAGRAWTINLVRSERVAGLESKSAEQAFALHHLTDKNIKVVNLGGAAGTGKSTLALAAAVDQVEAGTYSKIIVFRSIYAVGGQDLGFLPGDESEKFAPWTAAVYDALESFVPKGKIEHLKRNEKIEVLPLTHIRGRTFSNAFIIIDESQNLERSVLLTTLTRLGKGSKAVLTGDVAQRDNLHVGRSDGIAEVAHRLYGQPLFAHVALRKSERSDVAEMASRLLDT